MYTHCIFCHGDLGRNEAVEAFPVGRRLAFDAARGRLWVVCRACERWNLSPLETRWEAVEECERHFRATRLRVSTENIGLARPGGGVELVRIGRPLRPELAAWRYGDQFGRRYRRQGALAAAMFAGSAGLLAAGPLLGLGVGGLVSMPQALHWMYGCAADRKDRRHVIEGAGTVTISRGNLARLKLLPDAGPTAWRLRVAHAKGATEVHGPHALRLAGQLLMRLNRNGGGRRLVRSAVDRFEQAGTPDRLLADAARRQQLHLSFGTRTMALAENDHSLLLALEMAAHEEQERQAIEEDLRLLEAAWREAEEIAAIADGLTMPAAMERELERLRGRRSAEGASHDR